jgi:outer membrane lipoprotein-sorting protein
LTFASIEINHTLNASLFELTLPKGVDVVEGY